MFVGVRAGIFVRDAKALCPHLVIIPYDFEAYEEVFFPVSLALNILIEWFGVLLFVFLIPYLEYLSGG